MSIFRVALGLVLATFASLAAAAPLEAYGKLPTIESAVVSPSGHAVAVVVTDGEKRTVVVKDLASGQITLRGLLGDHKMRDLQWAGDDHLLLVSSVTTNIFDVVNGNREWFYGNLIDLKKKRIKPLMRGSQADLAAIFGLPIVRTYRGEPTVFAKGVVFQNGRGLLSLFRIDLDNGSGRLVATGGEDTIDWVVDSEGQPVAQELYERNSGVWSLKLKTSTGWKEAASVLAPVDRPAVLGLGRDGHSVLYATRDDKQRAVWREVGVDGHDGADNVALDDAQSPLRAALDGRLIGQYTLAGDEDRYAFFDPADERAWKAIVAAYGGERVRLESWSTDRKKIVVQVDSRTQGPSFAIVDMGARRAEWLGVMYADLKPADISPREPVRFKAADGLALSGYLTLPRGRPAKALPLVVFPHGGPAARDDPGFDWWAQAMASRGYAVLQVNYRGSSGLGTQFMEAGYGEWGRKMQTDLSDGVRYLAAAGTIDPKRVCIVGASYGGYAALAGATLDTGVYRCAVSVSGPSDLKRMVDWSSSHQGSPAVRYWTRFMGAESRRDPSLAEISPAAHADRVAIPVLLVHGQDDTVVPLEQSRMMADALGKAGKPYEFVVEKGEDHWLSRGDTRLATLQATVAFLEKNNPPN